MMNLFENLQAMNEDDTIEYINKEEIEQLVLNGFETGHMPYKNLDDFEQDFPYEDYGYGHVIDAYNYYEEMVNMGPAGFYEEYSDKLDFSDSYKAEYGRDELDENKKLTESPELRTMTTADSWGWQGANDFRDGSKPLLADGEYATLVICGPDTPDEEDCANVGIYYGEDDNEHWAQKIYDTKEDAIKDSRILLKLLDDEIDENQLKRFGFDIVA